MLKTCENNNLHSPKPNKSIEESPSFIKNQKKIELEIQISFIFFPHSFNQPSKRKE